MDYVVRLRPELVLALVLHLGLDVRLHLLQRAHRIDEVVDEQFYTEFESALEQTLNKFAKRKYESRGSPPKDVLRCMYCNGAYWHLADGWGTAETLCGDPFVCRDCLYKESKK